MKRTHFRRLLPMLLTLVTVIVCIIGITATATESAHSNEIKYANLVLNDDVDLVFWADVSEETAQNKDTFMTFNDGSPVFYSQTQEIDGVTYVVYRLNNILPQNIGDQVIAKLFIDGALNSYTVFSVKEYCQYVLNNSESEALKTLVSDLLVYGEESQKLAGQDPESYVTVDIEGLVSSPAPDGFKVLYGTEELDNLVRNASVKIGQSKIDMTNGLELILNVALPEDADLSDYTAVLTINGREQEVRIVESGYYCRAIFGGIYSYELFDKAKIDIYKGDVRVSKSVTLCLASYLDALNDKEAYTDLTNAYYNYGYSAHVYGGSHTIAMPGVIEGAGMNTTRYDDYGTVTYTCGFCGEVIDSIEASHIRNFDGNNANGSPANSSEDGDRFTITTEYEGDNGYLSVIRDVETNTGTGSLSYYVDFGHARLTAVSDTVDSLGQYKSNKYTFDISVKAPEAGLTDFSIYLQNTNTTGSSRNLTLLDVSSSGAILNNLATIAPEGTITSDKWTDITVTIDFYRSNGDSFIYFEYYVNYARVAGISVPNTLFNGAFSRIYFAIENNELEDGQGVLIDNIMLAQDCVHSFTGSVAQHVALETSGSVRAMADKVHNEFDISDFSYVVRWKNGTTQVYVEEQGLRPMDTEAYPDPEVTPKRYDHPRVLFNSDDIPAIVENMHKEENARAFATFMSKVNSNVDGKLTPIEQVKPQTFEYTNYNVSVLRAIEAKALYYALFKDDPNYPDAKLHGYEAVYAMKNYLLTFAVQYDFSDQCRMYGEGMYYSALVYDWCYDLLTDEDKTQFRLGVQNLMCDGTSNTPWLGTTHEGRKLEGGFPALAVEAQTPLTGHGAEAQVLRDYFSFAIAIYDEDSTWYDYVGGMIYANYVDARNYFYTASYYPDGSAGYNVYRYVCDLYNAWLFRGMGVELPYNEENMATVIHGLMAMEINDNFMFATADGSGTSSHGQYRLNTTVGDAALISSYLFDDPVALTTALRLCEYEYQRNGFSHQLGISCAYYLILTSNGLTPAEDYREYVDNVEYHGGFQQQVISRNNKDDDGVVVLMQGAQHYPGGHTHQNAGSFQIWYKGMLTRDDGLYDAYGSDHHFFYHMSATAHNTLLIFNDEMKNSPVGPNNKIGFYNGGQKYELGIPASFTSWVKDEKFSYGDLLALEYDNEDNPSYVLFSNDITKAYDEDTVDYVERSIMTLYTGDDETPMVMFVFDNITTDSPDFQKTFLLQCAEEPYVDGNTVTVDNGEGKMVLTSLLGNDTIKAYGRTSVNGVVGDGDGSERFYLSGQEKNLIPGGATSIGDRNSDLSVVWGHLEVMAEKGQKTNQLMNVIYVSDSGTVVSASPTLLESDYMTGATFKDKVVMFINDSIYSSDPHTFVTTGEGTMTYYISGLTEGSWKVNVNGVDVGEYTATEEGKMITFQADPGTVTIVPNDARPAGTSPIKYFLNGGTLPEGTPEYYFRGEVTRLPIPTKEGATFVGWFLDESFETPISEIPATETQRLKLFAKWVAPIVNVDYTQGGLLSDYPDLNYNKDGGGDFKIVKGESPYLLWLDNDAAGGSIIGKDGKYASYANEAHQITFTLSLGRNGSERLSSNQIYLRDTKTPNGASRYINVFKTDTSGGLYIGQSLKFATLPQNGMFTFAIVLDFDSGEIIAYDEGGVRLNASSFASVGISLPSEYSSYSEWLENLSGNGSSLITFKCTSTGSIRIGCIKVSMGNYASDCSNFGPNSSAHKWDEGVVITEPSSTDCTPGSIKYTCQECGITKVKSIASNETHASLELVYEDGVATYLCGKCGGKFVIEEGYYMDGTDSNAINGVGNSTSFSVEAGTQKPLINGDGQYELLVNKVLRKEAQVQLWIPSMSSDLASFNSSSNATGFISFKINAYMDKQGVFMQLVDTNSNAGDDRWTANGCLVDHFFEISTPDANGKVVATGWDGIVLKEVTTGSDKFSGWMDIKIAIELNGDNDTITLHYYVDGQYVDSSTKELTISSNSINSIYISGKTKTRGSGIMLDDIAFGCSTMSGWGFDD